MLKRSSNRSGRWRRSKRRRKQEEKEEWKERSTLINLFYSNIGGVERRGDSLLAVERSDLEAEAAVIAVHRHDGAVVQVSDQAARHLAAALLHQVPALREEVASLPGRRHQTRLTAGGGTEGGATLTRGRSIGC